MDLLGQVLAQALLESAESPQRQQVCGDVSCVCVWRCFMHVGMAMSRKFNSDFNTVLLLCLSCCLLLV